MQDLLDEFRRAMESRGLVPPSDLITDGKIHRCNVDGRSGKGDGAYLLHTDSIPAGGFENWQDGRGWQNWRANVGRILTAREKSAYSDKIEVARRERKADEIKRHAEARKKASQIWNNSSPCREHAYLSRKGIKSHDARIFQGSLVLPLKDSTGVLHSLQFIDIDGNKRFLPGGRVQGSYLWIGKVKPNGVLCIAEGFATGASIHAATGYSVAVAFDCANLLPVAKSLRKKFHDLKIILCADDDHQTEGNPGLTKARQAAQVVGAVLAVPNFGSNQPKGATDFNDLHLERGLDAVRHCIEAGLLIEEDGSRVTLSPVLIRLADVSPEEVSWIWPQRIAKGKLTLVIGDPGLGKSFATLDMAARISAGYNWPDGTQGTKGSVILLSAEDGIADTIRPRLDTLKGESKNVHVLRAIKQNDVERGFCLATDLIHLESAILKIKASLVVIDPLSAYFGEKDTYKDSQVRSLLAPLATLAERTRVAVVAVMHVTKSSERKAIYRAVGSIGFVGAARIVLGIAKDPKNEDRRLLLPVKTNLSAPPPTLAFGIQNGILAWEATPVSDVDPDSVLSGSANVDERDERQDTDDFLREILRNGEIPQVEIVREAKKNGISDRTLRRAKKRLGIKSRHEGQPGFKGAWYWSLSPEDSSKSATDKEVAPFGQGIGNSHETTATSPKEATQQNMALFENETSLLQESGDDAKTILKDAMEVFPAARVEGRE